MRGCWGETRWNLRLVGTTGTYMKYFWASSIQSHVGIIRCIFRFFGNIYDFQNAASYTHTLRIPLQPNCFTTVPFDSSYKRILNFKIKKNNYTRLKISIVGNRKRKMSWNTCVLKMFNRRAIKNGWRLWHGCTSRTYRQYLWPCDVQGHFLVIWCTCDVSKILCLPHCFFYTCDPFSAILFTPVPCDSRHKSYLMEFWKTIF